MEILSDFKDWLLFNYYTKLKREQKALIAGSVVILFFIISAAIASLSNNTRVVTTSNANTVSATKFTFETNSMQSITQQSGRISLTPTPTPDLAELNNKKILSDALAEEWRRINEMPNSQKKISLNAKAAELEAVFKQKSYSELQPLIRALIRDVDLAESDIELSLTPSPTTSPTPTTTLTPTPTYGPDGSSYKALTIATERGNVYVRTITINSNDYNMLTVTADTNDCTHDCKTKSLATYVKENNAIAGINGTYFCPPDYAECASKKNSFDFPIYNSNENKWINSYSVSWNDRAIIYKNKNGFVFNRDAKSEWKIKYPEWYPDYKVDAGIINAPGLLDNGNVIGGNYPLTDKQKAKSAKVGIGFNTENIFLVIAYNVTMDDFGYVFKALGATDALNLDSGGSTALWYGGYKVGPGRSLPNAIVFVKK